MKVMMVGITPLSLPRSMQSVPGESDPFMLRSLSSWLAWQETLHHSGIDLGLDRLRAVMQRLEISSPECPVITIAGTKGKGSCAAMLARIYGEAGYRIGLFTSPHLRRYNERIQINGADVSDESLCVAFERIDKARGDVSLTYFEFNTLAAFLTFDSASLDIWILEVGMGGRLDAVNAIDADVAIVTSIGLDHTEWLGSDIESIAREKAGIFRTARPALYGAPEMPASIQAVADQLCAPLLRAGIDFGIEDHGDSWSWWMKHGAAFHRARKLPLPGIQGSIQLQNAGVSITAVQLLAPRLPVVRAALELGLRCVQLAGRFQILQSQQAPEIEWIVDVAHNPMSAQVLAQHLEEWNRNSRVRRTIAIIGMLSDKDVIGTVAALRGVVDDWIAVAAGGDRGLSMLQMQTGLQNCGVNLLASCKDVPSACQTAIRNAGVGDRVLICGSFTTAGPALNWLEQSS